MPEYLRGPDQQPVYYYFGHNASDGSILNHLRKKVAPVRFNMAARAITRELALSPEHKVLEIGCGVGLLGEAIQKAIGAKANYWGVDLNLEPGLKTSNRRGIEAVQADATVLPFNDHTFHHVVSTDVFEHVPNAFQLAQETYRILKPGGKAFIVISDPSEGRFYFTNDHIARIGDRQSDVPFWEEVFEGAGFRIDPSSQKYRDQDLRRIFNLPVLNKLKDRPGFSCAFRLIARPGVFVLEKPLQPGESQPSQ